VSVVMLLAYGEGFNQAILRGFKGAFGDGVSVMWPGQTSMQAGGERAGKAIRFRITDAEAVGQLPLIKAWSPEYMQEVTVAYGPKQAGYRARGVAPAYGTIRSQPAASGRFLDAEDVRLQRKVVFIGSEVARKLFGNIPPVGQQVRIKGIPFDVIGVGKQKVQLSNYGRPDRESVFIPYTTAGQVWNTEYVSDIVFQEVDPTLHERVKEQVMTTLGKRLRFNPQDDRAVRSFGSAESQKIIGGIVLGLKLVMSFIGILTLAIGGVGVMNIMLVSVTERTREIGLRKALGAKPRNILTQFLLEAAVLTFIGGAVGMLIAVTLAHVIPPMPLYSEQFKTANHEGDIFLRTSAPVMIASFVILSIVAISSGFYPAMKAARMDPVEALRYD